jgi:hypothetical protein
MLTISRRTAAIGLVALATVCSIVAVVLLVMNEPVRFSGETTEVNFNPADDPFDAAAALAYAEAEWSQEWCEGVNDALLYGIPLERQRISWTQLEEYLGNLPEKVDPFDAFDTMWMWCSEGA